MSEVKLSEQELFDLRNEIVMAQKLNEDQLRPQIQEAILRYTGRFFPNIGQDWDILLNEIYPVIQFNLPSIYFRNPRVFLKPRSKNYIAKRRNPITGEMEEQFLDSSKSAKTQEAILNYSLEEMKYKKECQKVLFDALLFKFGVMWHGYKGDFGMTEEQSIFIQDEKLFVKRLNPLRFLKDPAVGINNLEEARWVGRSFDVPLLDLQEDPTMTLETHLKGKYGYGDQIETGTPARYGQNGSVATSFIPSTRPLLEFADKEFKNSARSRFVEVIEVFIRPTPKEKRNGEKGKVVLLTMEQKKPLRKPNEWPYKAKGSPAHILEFNPLADQQFGLSDLDTYKTIADQKNVIINLQLRNAQENSKVWVAIAKDAVSGEEDLEIIRSGNQTIVMFNGESVQGKMTVASPNGGASSELYLIDGRIQKNLEDKSGVTDLKRGFLQSGEESAASVKIRSAGGSVRPSYRQDIMTDYLKGSFLFINQLNKQFMTVKDAVRITGSLDLEWSDTPTKEEVQADVDVELDVISMLPENPEKELQELQQVLSLMVQGLTEPTIVSKLAQEGKTIELSPLIEQMLMRLKIRNPDIFRNIRPEESMGFSSNQQLEEARANVKAVLAGQPAPIQPAEGQDHKAHALIYTDIAELIQGLGDTQALQQLKQLIQIHQIMAEEELKVENPRSKSPLKSGFANAST